MAVSASDMGQYFSSSRWNGSFCFLAIFEDLRAFNWLKMDTMIELSVVSSLFNLVFSYFCHFKNLCTVVTSDYAISLGNHTLVVPNFLPILQKFIQSSLVHRPSSPPAFDRL